MTHQHPHVDGIEPSGARLAGAPIGGALSNQALISSFISAGKIEQQSVEKVGQDTLLKLTQILENNMTFEDKKSSIINAITTSFNNILSRNDITVADKAVLLSGVTRGVTLGALEAVKNGYVTLDQAIQVVQAHERTRLHPVNIETPAQMIDFMLQDPGVPAGGLNSLGIAMFVPELDGHSARAFH